MAETRKPPALFLSEVIATHGTRPILDQLEGLMLTHTLGGIEEIATRCRTRTDLKDVRELELMTWMVAQIAMVKFNAERSIRDQFDKARQAMNE